MAPGHKLRDPPPKQEILSLIKVTSGGNSVISPATAEILLSSLNIEEKERKDVIAAMCEESIFSATPREDIIHRILDIINNCVVCFLVII